MPYFECEGCGNLISLTEHGRSERREYCPECDESTVWSVAFEDEEGVSF